MADGLTSQVDNDEIALRLMEGEKAGMRMLVEAHGPRVVAFLRKNHAVVAEDAFQDAVANVIRSMETFDDSKGSLAAWFVGIANNAARDLHRREEKHRHDGFNDDVEPVAAWGAPDEDDGEEAYNPTTLDKERKVIYEILGSLPPLQYKILMRDAEHPSGKADAAELADEFGSTAGSIRANRSKGWSAVDDELKRRGLPQRRKE